MVGCGAGGDWRTWWDSVSCEKGHKKLGMPKLHRDLDCEFRDYV